MRTMLRSASLLALASTALSAHADDLYSSLGPSPSSYSSDGAYVIGNGYSQAFRFTATATGALSGFTLAMNNLRSNGPTGYTIRLYSDSASSLGSVLGTYSGTSTGVNYYDTTSALSTVGASGPEVTITSGTRYWLWVASSGSLGLNYANAGSGRRYVEDAYSNYYLDDAHRAAFSLQLRSADPSAVPGPAAALAFALIALRRRKRA